MTCLALLLATAIALGPGEGARAAPKGLPEAPTPKRAALISDPGYRTNPSLAEMGWTEAWSAGYRGRGVKIAIWNPYTELTSIDCDDPQVRPTLWVNAGEDLNQNGRFDLADENGIDDDGNGCIDDVHGCHFLRAGSNGRVCAKRGLPHDAKVIALAAARVDGRGLVGWAPEADVVVLRGKLHGPADLERAFAYLRTNGVKVVISAIQAGPPIANAEECRRQGQRLHPEWETVLHHPDAPFWVIGFPNQWPMCDPDGFAVVGSRADKDAVVGNALHSVPNPFVDIAVTGHTESHAQSWALGNIGGILAVMFQRYPNASREEIALRLCRTAAKIGKEPYDGTHPRFEGVTWNATFGCGRLDLPRALGLK